MKLDANFESGVDGDMDSSLGEVEYMEGMVEDKSSAF